MINLDHPLAAFIIGWLIGNLFCYAILFRPRARLDQEYINKLEKQVKDLIRGR